ncbi:predicted protein [Aspergillus terreus NIH2624]|uniref:DUF7605 domain-containing protein n=1 Tax=Aspergillus terreus (strain NIH 2624 / FGSC A1156) TaxID=341663 RepID=Q0CWA1_ASPTN|nr:uncharacterized protein ATEG_02033 [Aspergillus terreus NIH2624]EAU36995.1 predicted protein [Aspergillus terreus NIH2624]
MTYSAVRAETSPAESDLDREHAIPSIERTFSCTSSSTGRLTPTSSHDESVSPNFAMERSTTPMARSPSETVTLHRSPSPDGSRSRMGSSKTMDQSSLTPHHATTTYRDLYDATPSPSARKSESNRRAPVTTPSPPSAGRIIGSSIKALSLGEDTNRPAEELHTDGDHGSEEGEHDTPDDNDENYSYSIRQEELPPAPIYDRRLQNALKEVRTGLTQIASLMQTSELYRDDSSAFYNLYQQTLEASQFTYPETRLVGFIGDSGVGKSTLINSLLDREGLARSSGDGAACTTVVTEFRHVDAQHPRQYTIEADFMDLDEIQELLEELLRSFRGYYTREFVEVESAQEQEKIKAAAIRARDTLTSLFPNHAEVNHEYLAAEGIEAEQAILQHLKELVMGVRDHWPGGPDAEQYRVVAEDDDECKNHLDELTTDPGFRDLNYARVRATERYLRHHCDEVFIVSTIIRCTTDPSIDDIINRCAQNQPIRIVCTRSEEVNPSETARAKDTPRRDCERIRDYTDRIQGLEKLKRFLISRRNDQVTQTLSRKRNDRARVFCVSNTLYSDHREDDRDQADEYIRLSGIPELRRYCQSVPAEAQLRSTESFIKNQAPAILGSLTQWTLARTDSVTVDRAETLRQVLSEAEKIIQTRLHSHQSGILLIEKTIESQFKNQIVRELRDIRSDWKDGAIEASRQWETWHHASYAAWCRNHGTHTTKTVGYRCWNEEILQPMFEIMDPCWDEFMEWLEEQGETLEEQVSDVFQTVCDLISAISPRMPWGTFKPASRRGKDA